MEQTAEERVFYDQDGVRITNKRAIIGETTYALANVTSVSVGRKVPSSLPGGALLVVGVLLLFAGFASRESTESLLLCGGLGAVLALAGIVALRGSMPSYYVSIVGAGGEQQALGGRSQADLQKIADALNDAIASRA